MYIKTFSNEKTDFHAVIVSSVGEREKRKKEGQGRCGGKGGESKRCGAARAGEGRGAPQLQCLPPPLGAPFRVSSWSSPYLMVSITAFLPWCGLSLEEQPAPCPQLSIGSSLSGQVLACGEVPSGKFSYFPESACSEFTLCIQGKPLCWGVFTLFEKCLP